MDYKKSTEARVDVLEYGIRKCTESIDEALANDEPIPMNLIIEARHYRLQIDIKKLREAIEQSTDSTLLESPKRVRLQTLIARAKELGRLNAMLQDLSRQRRDISIMVL